jgi:hypothetical protein
VFTLDGDDELDARTMPNYHHDQNYSASDPVEKRPTGPASAPTTRGALRERPVRSAAFASWWNIGRRLRHPRDCRRASATLEFSVGLCALRTLMQNALGPPARPTTRPGNRPLRTSLPEEAVDAPTKHQGRRPIVVSSWRRRSVRPPGADRQPARAGLVDLTRSRPLHPWPAGRYA